MLLFATRSVSDDPVPSRSCPSSTVRPDANGWVPPGTCGYLSRPYYPSFIVALVFCAIASAVLLGFAWKTILAIRRGREEGAPTRRSTLNLPLAGLFLSTCLLVAYVLRVFGTKHQQVPEFVAFSDTLVLMCPISVFILDCVVLNRSLKALPTAGKLLGTTPKTLSRVVTVAIPLLAAEQLCSSMLIAPKHRPSHLSNTPNHAMLGVQLYLVGIGLQGLLMVYALTLTVALQKKDAGRDTKGRQQQTTITYTLIISLVALLTRTAYRLVELSAFFTGYMQFLAHSEVYFYAFECMPVLTALGVWMCVRSNEVFLGSSSRRAYGYHELHMSGGDDEVRHGDDQI